VKRLPWLIWFVALGACSRVPPPNDQRIATEKVISEAQEAGAQDEPEAELRLKNARELLENAERAMRADENEIALRLLGKSKADGELARGIARRTRAEKALQEAKDQLAKLKANSGGTP
jgi:hypothetical protein